MDKISETRYISAPQFAKICKVAPVTVYGLRQTLLKGVFRKITNSKRYRVDTQHPNAIEYYKRQKTNQNFGSKLGPAPKNAIKAAPPAPKPAKPPANQPNSSPNQDAESIYHDKERLENLTLKEITIHHQGIHGFNQYVKALKDIADYQNKSILARQRRGELIERDGLAASCIGLVDSAYRRIVSEMPIALAPEVMAIAKTGKETAQADIVKLMQTHAGKILQDCKKELKTKLTKKTN